MTQEAILPDVSEVAEQPEPAPSFNKHQTDLEAIVERRRVEQAGKPVVVEPEEDPSDKAEVPMIELVGEDGGIIKVPASAKFKAKVDGQDVSVPFEQITRSYQKDVAADKRLEDVSRRQKELESKERDLEARGQELSEKEKTFVDQMGALDTKKEKGTLSDDAYRENAKRLLNALSDSEEPEAEIAEIFKGLSAQGKVDPSEVERKAEEVYKKREKEREMRADADRQGAIEKERLAANNRFETEYADIISDPFLYSAAKQRAREKWAAEPNANPWEVAASVGNEIREWKTKNSTTTQAREKPPTTVRTASARASVGKDPEPITRKSVLDEMKKTRGQPV